jgi:hypothetical protein
MAATISEISLDGALRAPTIIGHWKIGHLIRRIHATVREFSGRAAEITNASSDR